MIPARLEKYRLPPGKPKTPRWSAVDQWLRQKCLECNGRGHPFGMPDIDCKNCDGEGYRWPDVGAEAERR